MAYNLNTARQFHSLFGVELASNTPTWVDLTAWRGVEVYAKYRITDYVPFLCVDMNANTCIASNSKQCTCKAFNLNASFELDTSSITYLVSVYLKNTCFDLKVRVGVDIEAI